MTGLQKISYDIEILSQEYVEEDDVLEKADILSDIRAKMSLFNTIVGDIRYDLKYVPNEKDYIVL